MFKIDASRCFVKADDDVSPDTEIGTDYESGETVRAGCRGNVTAVLFSGAEHALTVKIRMEN
ncbi:MAG: hypothetical protein R2941_11795 [Desulfobacterales bacterium]